MGKARVNRTWTNKKIQEWRQRLRYVSAHLVKKIFETYNQDLPGARHACEVMQEKSYVVRFPSLPDPMRGIRHNKNFFKVDVTEFTHDGKKRWGLVFYGANYRLLAYYMLGLKYPTATPTLDTLGQLISEKGIHRQLIKDRNSIFCIDKQCRQVLGRTFTPLFLSKPDKHNKNPVKCTIKT